MEEKSSEQRQLLKIEEVGLGEMSLEQKQLAERLYHELGLSPVVDKTLEEFRKSLLGRDKITDKVFGPYDIKGRADAVAKVTALVTYAALSEQYTKEVGNLESEITTIEGERDKVRTNYDKLVERVTEVVGGDYDELKTNYNELVKRLAEVEQLRAQIAILNKEKAQLTKKYESQITRLKNEHNEEVEHLRSQITDRDSKIEGIESERITLTSELEQLSGNYDQLTTIHETLTGDYDQLKTAIATLAGAIPYAEITKKLREELYTFLLENSKVPDMVIDGVGKFIDFKKYLGIALERGAKEANKHAEEILGKALGTIQ